VFVIARGKARDREWIESVYRDYLDDLSPSQHRRVQHDVCSAKSG
jgi:hypothetical protein